MPGPVSAAVTLVNIRGLHARASAKFCAVASSFDAAVKVTKDEFTVGGCSIMGLMTLGAGVGSEILISAEGPQAEEAVHALVRLVEERFGEGE
jgi:phosphocarrier protein